MMMKKTFCLILSLLLVSACSCAPSNYQKGVNYDGYPDSNVPVYPDAVVFEYNASEDGSEVSIKFGTHDDIDDIADFYQTFFTEQAVATNTQEGFFGSYIISGNNHNGMQFIIEIYSAGRELKRYYKTITEITIDYNHSAVNTNTIADSLLAGILQYYPTGNEEYDRARQSALKKIDDLAYSLHQASIDSLSYAAALAQQLSDIWERPREEIQWPVLYGLNSANISYLQALGYIDGFENEELPTALRQTARPLYALGAASCIEDSIMHLLIANGYYEWFASNEGAQTNPHWNTVMQIWQEAKPVFTDMIGTAQQLSIPD